MQALFAIFCYFLILLTIGILSSRRKLTSSDFILGNRSLNYWLTALAAHASDMSSWLFMAYPATILIGGVFHAWTAIGLILFMFLNWQFVAPKIRKLTERYQSLTFSSFFESRFADTSGRIRIFTALMSLFFYTIYISSGLMGLGMLLETLFGIDYSLGILIGLVCVIPYMLMGGYVTLAWIDLFQGLFLMGAIIFVPLFLFSQIGGFSGIQEVAGFNSISLSLLPDFSSETLLQIIGLTVGWGLGYFGQPHIVTKFMGIRHAEEIPKSKYIGMSWMILSIGAATLVGLVGIAYFSGGIASPEEVFIRMVKESFPRFLGSFILCSVIATTINAMSAQVLVLSSTITEDFYKRIFNQTASSEKLLLIARLGVIGVMLIASGIAFSRASTINSLVFYAWSGLGCSFGPLLLLSLYSQRINKFGAWSGILTGGLVSALWPYLNQFLKWPLPSMLPGFLLSLLSIVLVSRLTEKVGKAEEAESL